MKSYRLLLSDKRGRLLESWVIDCDEDREAIEAAKDEVRRCEYVEIWKGGRPIGIYARPLQLSRLQRLVRYRLMRTAGLDRAKVWHAWTAAVRHCSDLTALVSRAR